MRICILCHASPRNSAEHIRNKNVMETSNRIKDVEKQLYNGEYKVNEQIDRRARRPSEEVYKEI